MILSDYDRRKDEEQVMCKVQIVERNTTVFALPAVTLGSGHYDRKRTSFLRRCTAFLLVMLMMVVSGGMFDFNGLTGVGATTAYAAEQESAGQGIVKSAVKYLGYGYSQAQRNGVVTGTYDCTSLVMQVYKEMGLTGTPTYTREWLTKIENKSLDFKKGSKSLPVYYADSTSSYTSLLSKYKDKECFVVLRNRSGSTTDRLEKMDLPAGTVVVYPSEKGNVAHAMIVIGKYGTYPSDSSRSKF